MKVELLVSRAGPAGVQNRGDQIDVPDDEARRMIDAEQAIPVREQKAERAIPKAKPEKAAK